MSHRRVSFLLPALLTCLLLAAAGLAHAASTRNPANRYSHTRMDTVKYDYATHCTGHARAGTVALQHWLENNRPRGESWGIYRCEKLGKHSYSLHAEGRALDWHLDKRNSADFREAHQLMKLLLATDRYGNPQALAARMGVQELIYNCKYWSAGSGEFRRYSLCYGRNGKLRKHVDPTEAHQNHIHIGLTRDGAAKRTSFWRHPVNIH